MAYKKLDEDELKTLYNNLRGYFDSDHHSDIVRMVNKYYPKDLISVILVSVSSEYNDNGYDNSVTGITCYDENDIEVPLSRDQRSKFNNAIEGISLPEFENNNYGNGTNEPVEDIVIYINKDLPEIYIKE